MRFKFRILYKSSKDFSLLDECLLIATLIYYDSHLIAISLNYFITVNNKEGKCQFE